MKTIFKLLVVIIFFVFSIKIVFAQDAEKAVTITVSGSGKSQEEAKQSALRSAIEQAFGVFISSKTEILNDQVVAEQMASVSSGNIKSFLILNESQLPDGRWGVTLKAIVSVDKLTSFVEAKGVAIEIKGGMFALNIKQQSLNELGEVKAVSEMVGLLHEPMQISFDYVIKSSDPKSLDADNKNWGIPLEVSATSNKNIDFCANYFIKTLAALSLIDDEVAIYKSLNKTVYPVLINYKGVAKTFYLRKKASINIINSFLDNWEFYLRSFTVRTDIDESNGKGLGKIRAFNISKNYDLNGDKLNEDVEINFFSTGLLVGIFSWQDKLTLSQIEKLNGYTVKPTGVSSLFKNGGFVVYEKDGHGLVASVSDLETMDWDNAKRACSELVSGGYSDWHLPSLNELNALYVNLYKNKIGGFAQEYVNYFSSEEVNFNGQKTYCVNQYFDENGKVISLPKEGKSAVRAVRAF